MTGSRGHGTFEAMNRPTPEDLDRMTLSRVTLRGLQRVGMSGRPEDNARMLRQEIAKLDDLVGKYPTFADTLGVVQEGYRALLRTIEH